jgi:hypothetical protein
MIFLSKGADPGLLNALSRMIFIAARAIPPFLLLVKLTSLLFTRVLLYRESNSNVWNTKISRKPVPGFYWFLPQMLFLRLKFSCKTAFLLAARRKQIKDHSQHDGRVRYGKEPL